MKLRPLLGAMARGVTRRLGYDLTPLSRRAYPYLERFDMHGHSFDFWIHDETGESWYSPEGWRDGGEARELARLVQPGDRVLELGCHHGLLTVFTALRAGPTGRVVAIDPIPRNVQVAQSQLAANQIAQARVLNLAASNQPGTLQMAATSGSSVALPGAAGVVSVNAVTGDSLDEQFGPFNVLKVDVEGFETQVLEGCRRLLARRPKLALEVHGAFLERYGGRMDRLWELIDAPRYTGTMILRPDYETVHPFRVEAIAPDALANLFLT